MALSDIFSLFSSETVTSNSKSSGKVVGIDIGSSSIKVVELQNRNDVLTLTTYGEIELGPYAEESPAAQAVVLPANVERQALVDILRESAVKARQAVFAMPLSSSFVTTMSIQALELEDISPRVRVEARKYIPIPISEVTLDWAEVDSNMSVPVDKNTARQRDVLLAAIQNDALARFSGLMDTVELPKTPIEIECFSAIRALYSAEDTDTIVVDIGAVSAKLYIVRNGLLQRMYRVRAGGAVVTEKISKDMGCTFEEAEIKKRSVHSGDTDFSQIQKIHHTSYERVFKEFKQVVNEYEQKLGINIPAVYMIGGGSSFPGFDSFLGNIFAKPVLLSQPFNKVAYPAFMEDTMNVIGPTFSVALGAALRSFE